MDWYGVGPGNLLGMIDLDSLWLELGYSDTHDADATCQLSRIMCYTGTGILTNYAATTRGNLSAK